MILSELNIYTKSNTGIRECEYCDLTIRKLQLIVICNTQCSMAHGSSDIVHLLSNNIILHDDGYMHHTGRNCKECLINMILCENL